MNPYGHIHQLQPGQQLPAGITIQQAAPGGFGLLPQPQGPISIMQGHGMPLPHAIAVQQPLHRHAPHLPQHPHQGTQQRGGLAGQRQQRGSNAASTHPYAHESSGYQLAARMVSPMKMTATGTYRLQMSHCSITDANINDFLRFSRDKMVESYSQTSQAAGQQVEFKDVPVVEVTLNRNALTDVSLRSITEFILSNKNIAAFEILSNQLTDEGAIEIANLARSSQLHRIKIGDNRFTSAGATTIAEGLRDTQCKLMQLHVSGNKLGDEGVKELCDAAAVSPLEVFGLREVAVGPRGWRAIGEMLCSGTCVVKEIQLKGNSLTKENAADFALAFEGMPETTPALKGLSMPGCEIGADACLSLSKALPRFANLTQLDLSSNPLTDVGGCVLARWIGSGDCPHLVGISLCKTQITVETVRKMHDSSVPGHQGVGTLTALDLSCNSFDTEGAGDSVEQLLGACPSLLNFSLHHCNIRTGEIPPICSAIGKHPTLTEVDMSSNFSCDVNAQHWGNLVRNTKTLTRLILTDNQMDAGAVETIVTSLQASEHRSISFLQVGGQSKVPPTKNNVPQHLQGLLSELLNRNRREDLEEKRGGPSAHDVPSVNAQPDRAGIPEASAGNSRAGSVHHAAGIPTAEDFRRQMGYPEPAARREDNFPGPSAMQNPRVAVQPQFAPFSETPRGSAPSVTPLIVQQPPQQQPPQLDRRLSSPMGSKADGFSQQPQQPQVLVLANPQGTNNTSDSLNPPNLVTLPQGISPQTPPQPSPLQSVYLVSPNGQQQDFQQPIAISHPIAAPGSNPQQVTLVNVQQPDGSVQQQLLPVANSIPQAPVSAPPHQQQQQQLPFMYLPSS